MGVTAKLPQLSEGLDEQRDTLGVGVPSSTSSSPPFLPSSLKSSFRVRSSVEAQGARRLPPTDVRGTTEDEGRVAAAAEGSVGTEAFVSD